MINLDIILLVHNQLDVTKICLQSIQQYTKMKYAFIIVDNNSKDKSKVWIHKFCKKHKIKLTYIHNKTNKGVSKGWNQGLRKSTAEYIAILNNDIVVTPNWEINLYSILLNCPTALLAYPNSMQGDFTLENITSSLKQFSFAVETTEMFTGYCFMIKKQCLKKIGYFDERFTPYLCEDTDYAYRLMLNNTPAVKVCSSFIYHLRSHTLKTKKYEKVYERNKKKLADKYSKELDIDLYNLNFQQQSAVISKTLDKLTMSMFDAINKFVDVRHTDEVIPEKRLLKRAVLPVATQLVYKIISPVNFVSSKNVKHGQTLYFVDKPEWANTDNGIVVEKIVMTNDELANITFEDCNNN